MIVYILPDSVAVAVRAIRGTSSKYLLIIDSSA